MLVVPVSSIRTRHYDKTTVIDRGVHSFIKHPSYIRYGHAQQKSERDIEGGIRDGLLVAMEAFSEELLEHIQNGFRTSKFAKPYARNFLDECD